MYESWGGIIWKLDEYEDIMTVNIDVNQIENVRSKIPRLLNEISF